MKKLMITLFLFCCIGMSLIAKTPSSTAFPNSEEADAGSAANPYKISSIGDLYLLADLVNAKNADYWGKNYELTADLDLVNEGDDYWTPIGIDHIDNCFRGTFDGKGHTIKNLKYGTAGTYKTGQAFVGLFGGLRSGSISNLKLEDVAIYATVASGEYFVGGLVGQFRAGIINNCSVSGTVKSNASSVCNLGVLAGKIQVPSSPADALIINCYTSGTVEGTFVGGTAANMLVGGIVGNASGSNVASNIRIVNSYSSSDVIATGTSGNTYAGGIAGQFQTDNINFYAINCYSSGDIKVKSTGSPFAGGIVARLNSPNANINNCIALNDNIILEGKGTNQCFRIAVKSNGNMSDNYALSTDFMTIQRPNSSLVTIDVDVTADVAAHGADLAESGASKSAQISTALTKLNAYVTANPTYSGITLRAWAPGSTYPAFKVENNPASAINPISVASKAQIVNNGYGFNVSAENLSQVSVYTPNGQQACNMNASSGSVNVTMGVKGLVIVVGYDAQGNKLFAQKHLAQ